MTLNLVYTTIIILILLIGIDLAFYRFRLKRFNDGKPFLIGIQKIIERIETWLSNKWKSAPRTKKITEVASTNKSSDPDKSITTITTTISRNSVHLKISAQIPKGTALQISLKGVDGKGKSFTQKELLSIQPQSSSSNNNSLAESNNRRAEIKVARSTKDKTEKQKPRQVPMNILDIWDLKSATSKFKFKISDQKLFLAALAIYILVVVVGIDRYPIYFFTDEAIHMNLASDFLRDHFQNYFHEFLPTFFTTEGWVNGISVYVQVIPFLLFGKSVIVTRLVSASITVIGALALGLFLKQIFKIKYYWAGVPLLLTTPAWFLHARTAFEYTEVASFFSIFLYFYGRYRDGHLPSLYLAIIAGALTFYTHGLGQVLIGTTGLAFAIIDIRYHLNPKHRKTILFGFGLAILLFLPFVRYYHAHSGEALSQINRRASYWTDDNFTLSQKVWEFIRQYAYGLNPLYWYIHNSKDLDRHVMKGFGNGLWFTMPFAIIGIVKAVRNIRFYPNRITLIALLAAPLPASIVAIGMPRMLWMSIPLAILTTIGLSDVLERLEVYKKEIANWMPVTLFSILTSLSLFILTTALVNGPTWFEDYGLYGMQYGAKQVFQDTVLPDLQGNPDLTYIISPSWANGTEKFMEFFIPESLRSRVSLGQPIDRVNNMMTVPPDAQFSGMSSDNQNTINPTTNPFSFTPNLRFIVTSNEYDKLVIDPKFKNITVYKTLLYPNGQPGFYVLSLNIADNIGEIMSAEKEKDRTPIEAILQLHDQKIRVLHSPFGSGSLESVFDNDPDSLVRVLEANPFIFDLYPEIPIDTHSMVLQTGSLPDFTVTVSLYAPNMTDPTIYEKSFKDLPSDPLVSLDFNKGPAKSIRIYIEIKDNISGASSQIHIRTIKLE